MINTLRVLELLLICELEKNFYAIIKSSAALKSPWGTLQGEF